MKRTALYEEHLLYKGKMVQFSNWMLPLHYGSQIQEHKMVREHVGLFDVSHMQQIHILGQDATIFLRYMLANDVIKLYPGKALYSCILNHSGGIKDDLLVYKLNESKYRLVVNASTAQSDLAWFQEKAKDFDVEIEVLNEHSLIALQGPKAKEVLHKLSFPQHLKPFHCHEDTSGFIARTGYTGEDGFEISVNKKDVVALWRQCILLGAKPCGLGSRDTLRLEAGLNLYGQDMDEATHPFESNLRWTVDLSDQSRNFIGRLALEKILHLGVKHILVGLVLREGSGIIRHGMRLYKDTLSEASLGIVTSGGFSPSFNVSIAIARVEAHVPKVLWLDLRAKRTKVDVVDLPFIRAGKATFEHNINPLNLNNII